MLLLLVILLHGSGAEPPASRQEPPRPAPPKEGADTGSVTLPQPPPEEFPALKEEVIRRLEQLERARRQVSFRLRSVRHLVSAPPTAFDHEFNGSGESYKLKSFEEGRIHLAGHAGEYAFFHQVRKPRPAVVDRYFAIAQGADPEVLSIRAHYWFPDGCHCYNPILPLLRHPGFQLMAVRRSPRTRTLTFHLQDGPSLRGVRLEAGSLTFDERTGGMIRSDVVVHYVNGPSREQFELSYRDHPTLGFVPERSKLWIFDPLTGREIAHVVREWADYAPGRADDPEFRLTGLGFREP